jgi:hypothetical protein
MATTPPPPSIDDKLAVASLVPPGECATSTLPAEHCPSVVESARTRSPIPSFLPGRLAREGREREREREKRERREKSDGKKFSFAQRKGSGHFNSSRVLT